MRGAGGTRPQEEEEESVFISMADMTISFLFVIMILLAFFATQFTDPETVPRSQYDEILKQKNEIEKELRKVQTIIGASDLQVSDEVQAMKEEIEDLRRRLAMPDAPNQMEVYNNKVSETRRTLLTSLKKQIDEIKGVNVSISATFESLQFSGDGLFETNADVPTATGSLRVSKIAEILDRNLGCFSLGPRKRFSPDCNPGYAVIDSLQVEGHTDDRGTDILNMRLSANRASSVYSLMTSQRPDLLNFNNRSAQPVLSVAGFGKGRPIQSNATDIGKDANRRIDLRFIMAVPAKEADISAIKNALTEVPR
ncbi:flagellar motor protein MotB [Neorhizobium galegae]|uniref:OmpA family protein n=1 Tax=Neorhizobium galegae TaxID=399 RepID=UPI001AE17E87|nr:OmpA family protein [Neorhizobium galegae]MBP2560107.1 flagellar motor protein MotB [Neorhizobium galegae]